MTDTPADTTAERETTDRRNGEADRQDEEPDHASDGEESPAVLRRTVLRGIAATGGAGALGGGALADAASAEATTDRSSGWSPKEPQLYTPWTEEVGPDNAHPEYPRPQLVRKRWRNLNGVWQFSGASEGEDPPVGQDLDESILVPYPVESALSGIKRHETWMWYRRTFSVPNEWRIATTQSDQGAETNRLLLHFERVDWEATVYVNGEQVATHQGGYDHFVADVTDALTTDGEQELVVGVFDPTSVNTEPIGTQPKGRQGEGTGYKGEGTLEMTPSSGIWDTVWLEPVPEAYIEGLDMTPNLDDDALELVVEAPSSDGVTAVAKAFVGDEQVGRASGPPNETLSLEIADPHLWSPDDPFLYDLTVELRTTVKSGTTSTPGKLIDAVESYFGMRSVGKRTYGDTARPTLNGETLWHLGTLESGQWPDGLYTAPTDEALRYNLAAQKKLGYNMVRKHVKVEPRRWFYHADQLGLLVWQDMPNMHEGFDTAPRDEAVLEHFEEELTQIVTEHDNHPSMAVWIPINEGWGINNDNLDYQRRLARLVSELDPERLVDPHSGYDVGSNHDPGVGDVKDVHQYGTPWYQIPEPEPDRISALGEYTSTSLVVEDHHWGECESPASAEEFVSEYVDRVEALGEFMVGRSMSASVYTATTGLENVCNGVITYDREVLKPTLADDGLRRVREAHESLIEKSKLVMGNVAIDVESPPAYVSGGLLGNAKPFTVEVTVTNPESPDADARPVENVSASLSEGVPADWSVETTSDAAFDAVPDGETATATWKVTPDATPDGDVTFGVTVTYEVAGEQYTYDTTRTVSAAQLGYWRFENSPEDDSSYDTPLSLGGGASFDDAVALEADYSLHLDGEGDYAGISDFDAGILHDRFTERTVSMWVKPDDVTGDQVLYNEGGYNNGLGLRISDGSLDVIVAGNGTASVSAPFSHTDWTHVAVVFDHGAVRLYVNGDEVAATEDAGFEVVPGHIAGSELGGNTTTTPWQYETRDHFFGGHIDATAVYNLALTDDDIAAVSTRSFAVDAPDLYTSGDDPSTLTVDATFSDLGADDGATFENLSMELIELPDGWSSTAQSETTFEAVPNGESVTATWDVTPGSSATGEAELAVAVEYERDGESRRLVDGATLETLESTALARWPFDGSTDDTSGNGHAATLMNGASFDDTVAVEGSHSVAMPGPDDYVDLAGGGDDFLSQAFSRRSVTMWVKPASTSGSQILYNQGAEANGMAVRINDGTLQAGTVSDGSLATVAASFTNTAWTHVAFVFDRGSLRLFVNGEQVAATDAGYDTVGSGYWGGEFGAAEKCFWHGNFDGHIDLSALYPFALTAEQVAALAEAY